MPKYLCLQRSFPAGGGEGQEKPSPAQMQEMYAKIGAWQEKFKKNLADMGGKLGDGKLVTGDRRQTVQSSRSKSSLAAT